MIFRRYFKWETITVAFVFIHYVKLRISQSVQELFFGSNFLGYASFTYTENIFRKEKTHAKNA